MERYHLDSITAITFRPTAFQYLICDQFLLVNDTGIANYTDDTKPYVSGNKISTVGASLDRSANLMFNWFTDNQIKENEGKCHELLSTDETLHVKIGATFINSSKYINIYWK